MPTPSPIIAASAVAKSAVSITWVPSVTRLIAVPSATIVVTIGRLIATTRAERDQQDHDRGEQADHLARAALLLLDLSHRLAAGLDLQAVAAGVVGGVGDLLDRRRSGRCPR